MDAEWARSWHRSGQWVQGGQGRGFAAQDRDGRKAFIKELRRQRDRRARRRFRREVASYETLGDAAGLPRLLDHNADQWADMDVPLFLAMELIEGPRLDEYITSNGPLELEVALTMLAALCATVSYCHENDIVHRDLKPTNILLRNGAPSEPVIVDFGLAFNSTETEPELTRVNEEVGNRFLRLPEHSNGGRSPVSDVTQLVGVLAFALTGEEPRVLVDGNGNAPHHRAPFLQKLAPLAAARPQEAQRILSVLDRGLSQPTAARYQSATELSNALARVTSGDSANPGVEELLSQLDLDVQVRDTDAVATIAADLQIFRHVLHTALDDLVSSRSLTVSWGGGRDDFSGTPPYARVRFALAIAGTIPDRFVEYRIERRAPSRYVVVQDDIDIWHGTSPTDHLLVERVLADIIRDKQF